VTRFAVAVACALALAQARCARPACAEPGECPPRDASVRPDGGARLDGGPDGGTGLDGGDFPDGGALDGGAEDGGLPDAGTDGGSALDGGMDGGAPDGGGDGGTAPDGGPLAPVLSAVLPAQAHEGQRLPVYLTGANLAGAAFSVEPAGSGVTIEDQAVRADRAGLLLSVAAMGDGTRTLRLVAATAQGTASIDFGVIGAPAKDLPAAQSETVQGLAEYASLTVRGTLSGMRGTRAPLRIIVYGDVLIEGTVSVTGANGLPDNAGRLQNTGGLGGPGGGRGGDSGTADSGGSSGAGPGGGQGGVPQASGFASGGGGAGFAVAGDPGCWSAAVAACGPTSAAAGGEGGGRNGVAHLPLLEANADDSGGSGGGGSGEVGGGGGGGGGSVFLVALGKIVIQNVRSVNASGGHGGSDRPDATGEDGDDGGGGGGSGGAIWIAASEVSGNGALAAEGGVGGAGGTNQTGLRGGDGAPGRIRIDAAVTVSTLLPSGPSRFFGPAVDLSRTPALVQSSAATIFGAAQAGSAVTVRNATTGQEVTVTAAGTAGVAARGDFTASIGLTPGLNEIRIRQRSIQVDVDGDGAPDDVTVNAVTGNDLVFEGARPVGRVLVVSVPP
jgi:hypothetical protein